MKTVFTLLVALNILLFAVASGVFGRILPDGRDPDRMQAQLNPEKISVLPPEEETRAMAAATPAPPPAPKPIACLEFGAFTGDDERRAEIVLGAMNLGARLSMRHTEEQAGYIVYLPPFKSRAEAERASNELHRIGVNDSFIIQDSGPFRLAISLGVFRTEEAAKAQLTTLTQQGVKNAKTAARPTTVPKVYFQVRNVDPDLNARLIDLKGQFPGQDLHDCPAAAPAGASSSGT